MWWFEEVVEEQDDGSLKTLKRWEIFCREVDGGRDDTWAVWAAYDDYKALILCMHPTPEQQGLIGPLSFDYFLAFRKRWDSVADVHHYLHQDFAHVTYMMKRHRSIGAYRQEMEEKLHAEDKQSVVRNTTKMGFGRYLHEAIMRSYIMKLWFYCRKANTQHLGVDVTSIPKLTWAEYQDYEAPSAEHAAAGHQEGSSMQKKRRDRNAPKAGRSAWVLFGNAVRRRVMEEDPSQSLADVTKRIAVQWQALSNEHRAPYFHASAEERVAQRVAQAEYEMNTDIDAM